MRRQPPVSAPISGKKLENFFAVSVWLRRGYGKSTHKNAVNFGMCKQMMNSEINKKNESQLEKRTESCIRNGKMGFYAGKFRFAVL